MKLSIIVPVYNGEKFILKSYTSIKHNNLEGIDYEIIFVDNNSKDNSVKVIEGLKSQNPNIKFFTQSKQGEAQARNMGIEKAQGDYIYQLDVDDEVFPGALNQLMSVLDTHPEIDAVFGKMLKTDMKLSTLNTSLKESYNVIKKEKPYWGLKWLSDLSSVVGEAAFLHRRSNFKRIGYYNSSLKIGTDTAFDIKLGMTSNVAFIDIYVYLYYKHDGSTIQISKRQMPRAFMIWPRLVKEHIPFYLENPVPLRFKALLFSQLYQSMGRQLERTKGFSNRIKLKSQLLSVIRVIKVPFLIRFYLTILVLCPFEIVRKHYSYHIVPMVVRQIKK